MMKRFLDPAIRSTDSSDKDRVVLPILNGIKVNSDFKTILMPCTSGPELKILADKGVPHNNMVAIERDQKVWSVLKRRGLDVGYAPMDANEAIDHIWARHRSGFDFIYLDFFGAMTPSHMQLLTKIFDLKMLRKHALLLLTFSTFSRNLDTRWLNELLEVEYLLRVHKPLSIATHLYDSVIGKQVKVYKTVEARFR